MSGLAGTKTMDKFKDAFAGARAACAPLVSVRARTAPSLARARSLSCLSPARA